MKKIILLTTVSALLSSCGIYSKYKPATTVPDHLYGEEVVAEDTASFGNVGDLLQRAFVPLVAGGGFDHDVTVVVGHGVDGFVRRRRSAPHMDAPL